MSGERVAVEALARGGPWIVKAPWEGAPVEARAEGGDHKYERDWRLCVENGGLTIEVEMHDGTGYGACSHSIGAVIPLEQLAELLRAHGWLVSP